LIPWQIIEPFKIPVGKLINLALTASNYASILSCQMDRIYLLTDDVY